jgi:hypothetical protein
MDVSGSLGLHAGAHCCVKPVKFSKQMKISIEKPIIAAKNIKIYKSAPQKSRSQKS